jgi:hypothetical protein
VPLRRHWYADCDAAAPAVQFASTTLRSGGFWPRSAHALPGNYRYTDRRRRRDLSTWRIGSAYGAAFLSDLWFPARLDTARQGFIVGSLGLGLGFSGNPGAEFWPDIKSKLFRRT